MARNRGVLHGTAENGRDSILKNLQPSLFAREKRLKGWRREKKLNLIGTINPEFKDLAQIWGWKMGTAARSCSRAQWLKSSEQHG
jgi:hypothetical protein